MYGAETVSERIRKYEFESDSQPANDEVFSCKWEDYTDHTVIRECRVRCHWVVPAFPVFSYSVAENLEPTVAWLRQRIGLNQKVRNSRPASV